MGRDRRLDGWTMRDVADLTSLSVDTVARRRGAALASIEDAVDAAGIDVATALDEREAGFAQRAREAQRLRRAQERQEAEWAEERARRDAEHVAKHGTDAPSREGRRPLR